MNKNKLSKKFIRKKHLLKSFKEKKRKKNIKSKVKIF